MESFLRTRRHQMGADWERSGRVEPSEYVRVKTTLAKRLPSMNSVPQRIQFSASIRTIRPFWSYCVAKLPLQRAVNLKAPVAGRWKKCPLSAA